VESTRPATDADLARCKELLEAARTEAESQRGGTRLLEESSAGGSALAGWVGATAPDRRLLVGEFGGTVVGTAAGRIDGQRGHVVWCYVEEGARGVGVGAALVDALTRWFTEAGCTDMEAMALPGDRSTKQLYETSGLKARLLVMHRSLP
jgi:GNAT superfamily N-acetyltransferase